MVNLKNNRIIYKKLFLGVLLFGLISSCSKRNYVTKIEVVQIPVASTIAVTPKIETFITPYREHINRDLDSILAYCPATLDKSQGQWQSNIGNFMADVCFEKANSIFLTKESKPIDVCLLNHGGIRATIPKGNVTTRTAFEVMPFENSLMVVALTGAEIMNLIDYFVNEKKPHPLSGLKIYLNKNGEFLQATCNNKLIDTSKIYLVATSDYLSNGGDNMTFFLKNEGVYDLEYKIRNVLIDYFKEVDTIIASDEQRIIVE